MGGPLVTYERRTRHPMELLEEQPPLRRRESLLSQLPRVVQLHQTLQVPHDTDARLADVRAPVLFLRSSRPNILSRCFFRRWDVQHDRSYRGNGHRFTLSRCPATLEVHPPQRVRPRGAVAGEAVGPIPLQQLRAAQHGRQAVKTERRHTQDKDDP